MAGPWAFISLDISITSLESLTPLGRDVSYHRDPLQSQAEDEHVAEFHRAGEQPSLHGHLAAVFSPDQQRCILRR